MNRLHYTLRLSYDVQDTTADFILNIEAARTQHQSIVSETLLIPNSVRAEHHTDPVLANRIIRLRAGPGPFEVSYEAVVDVDHRLDAPEQLAEVPIAQLPFDIIPYLAPSRYCESDRLMEFSMREFGGFAPGYARVVAIRNWVNAHVRFLSRSSVETTSAVDTLVERVGVCRDFANLMIALCRALSIPARFSSSLDYGAAPELGPSDFHAFVEVYLSGRWYVFDPSGASIPTGLIRIGTGRDASDIPFAALFGRVVAKPPLIGIVAVTDAALGLEMPVFTPQAICTW